MNSIVKVVCTVLLFTALNHESDAACKGKDPTKDYKPELFKERQYLIAIKRGLPEEDGLIRCTTGIAVHPEKKIYHYYVTTEDANNQKTFVNLTMTNLEPPGRIQNNIDGTSDYFIGSVIGMTKKYHMFFACNPNGDNYGIWIYYYKRVNGFDKMDDDTKKRINKLLKDNKIPRDSLDNIDNKDCDI